MEINSLEFFKRVKIAEEENKSTSTGLSLNKSTQANLKSKS